MDVEEGGEQFVCHSSEVLPKYLENANLRDANLSGAYLTGANLENADLIDATLIDATLIDVNLENAILIDANLTGAKIDAVSLSDQIKALENIDLTNTQLRVGGELLDIEKSRKLIIEILVERGVTTARGLGGEYQAALIDAKPIAPLYAKLIAPLYAEPIAPLDAKLTAPPKKSESELAPSLAAAGFTIASMMPSEAQIKKLKDEPYIGQPLDGENPEP